MANLIDYNITYTQEEALAYFFQPIFIAANNYGMYDINYNSTGSRKLQKFSSLSKITRARQAGFNGSSGADMTQRTIAVVRAEAEASQDSDVFYNTIMGMLLSKGLTKDDLTTTVLKDIVSTIFFNACAQDFGRQIWLNDTTVSGTGATNYNFYDGIFKNYEDLPSDQKLTVGVSGADFNQLNNDGTLKDNAASAIFKGLFEQAPVELRAAISQAVLEVSGSIADNWTEELRSKGTTMGNDWLVNGISQLKWNGIPIIVHREWDQWINADGTLLGVNSPHRALLHVPKNIAIDTDVASVEQAEIWYNRDLKENRFRNAYLVGTQYKNDEYAIRAFADTSIS